MTIPQIVSLVGVGVVALMYLWPMLQLPAKKSDMLTHIKHVLAIRDSYPTPEVLAASNTLMEALLGIK